MNINDLPKGSYQPVSSGLNINSLPQGSYSPVQPSQSVGSIPLVGAPRAPQTPQPGLAEKIWNSVADFSNSLIESPANAIMGEWQAAGQKIGKGFQQMNQPAASILQGEGNLFEGGIRTASGLASAIMAPFTGLIKGGSDAISNKLSNSPSYQSFANSALGDKINEAQTKVQAVLDQHPHLASNISDIINIVGTIAALEGMRGVDIGQLNKEAMTKLGSDLKTGVTATQDAISNTASKISDVLTKNQVTDTEAVGKILQGKPGDIQAGLNTLREIPTEGVKTYKDLSQVLNDRATNLTEAKDAHLGGVETATPLDELTTGSTKFNFVKKALEDLKELYQKITAPEDVVRIDQLIEKANTDGLTPLEVDKVAREYGTEFGKKAFSKTGDPLTSVNAQSYENTRTGVKETARGLMPDDESRLLDKQISDTLNTKRLVDQMEQKVNALSQRVQQRGLIEKIARGVGKAVDIATFGGPKAFIQKLFFPSNVGLKTLNSLDLESMLSKNLQIIQKAVSGSDETLVQTLINQAKDFVQNPKIGMSIGDVTKNIPEDDLNVMRDYTDMVGGIYKPNAKLQGDLALDAQRIAEKYGFLENGKPPSEKVLANQFNKVIEQQTKPLAPLSQDMQTELGITPTPKKLDPKLVQDIQDSTVRMVGIWEDAGHTFDGSNPLPQKLVDHVISDVGGKMEYIHNIPGSREMLQKALQGKTFKTVGALRNAIITTLKK